MDWYVNNLRNKKIDIVIFDVIIFTMWSSTMLLYLFSGKDLNICTFIWFQPVLPANHILPSVHEVDQFR